MRINNILIKPLLTEKTTSLVQKGVYVFVVNNKANKNKIKEGVEKLFKVKVAVVRLSVRKGKIRKVGKKMIPKKKPDRKIAFVKLSEGKINIFPQT